MGARAYWRRQLFAKARHCSLARRLIAICRRAVPVVAVGRRPHPRAVFGWLSGLPAHRPSRPLVRPQAANVVRAGCLRWFARLGAAWWARPASAGPRPGRTPARLVILDPGDVFDNALAAGVPHVDPEGEMGSRHRHRVASLRYVSVSWWSWFGGRGTQLKRRMLLTREAGPNQSFSPQHQGGRTAILATTATETAQPIVPGGLDGERQLLRARAPTRRRPLFPRTVGVQPAGARAVVIASAEGRQLWASWQHRPFRVIGSEEQMFGEE